jgi:hypothetical protein
LSKSVENSIFGDLKKLSDQSLERTYLWTHYGSISWVCVSKLSLLQLASRGLVLYNGIKHCHIATMRKMLKTTLFGLS